MYGLRLDTHIYHSIIRIAGTHTLRKIIPTLKLILPWHVLKGNILFDFAMSLRKRKAFGKALSRVSVSPRITHMPVALPSG
jgi:hypothetical protein